MTEEEMIALRRKQAGLITPSEQPAQPQALALSGGGIRSATFCLGLLRALAKQKVLRHFDYLSTVSGGGYVGSAFGRLYGPEQKAEAVETGLERDDTLFLWWLRSNGRYLTPAGARDLGQAFASILRGVLSTHFEVAMLLLVASGIMVLPYYLASVICETASLDKLYTHGSFWWWALAVPVFLGLHNIFAYWFTRSQPSKASRRTDLGIAVICATAGFFWVVVELANWYLSKPPSTLAIFASVMLFTPLAALLWRKKHGELTVAQARLSHTKGLAISLWMVLLLALLGGLDWASWWLAGYLHHESKFQVAVPAATAALVAAARAALPHLMRWRAKIATTPIKTEMLLNITGLVLVLLVALIWATAFQFLVGPLMAWPSLSKAWTWLSGVWPWLPEFSTPTLEIIKWLVITGLPLAYILLTLSNLEMLNLSSLHNFYRARIERAYVSCGNSIRFKKGALAKADRNSTAAAQELTESVSGDDIALADYAPHLHGGPIHLINCCINQTIDDRTQNYNADRKGVALTVSCAGAESGAIMPAENAPNVPGTLSAWTAISGAAASSGMGSNTSPGLAALLFLSGLRLGYWHSALTPAQGADTPRPLSRPELINAEGLARFPGLRSPQWYLSDGGHFDNTAVYALLKRKVELIVMADCGADPDYRFSDVENLVRKAKIDYGATITFVSPTPTLRMSADEAQLLSCIGMPGDIHSRQGAACLLLARISYDNSTEVTTLVIVKPRLVPGLSFDITAYGERNGTFPQQSTGDQFFDEEQWEAYHQLGLALGNLLTAPNLQTLRAWT